MRGSRSWSPQGKRARAMKRYAHQFAANVLESVLGEMDERFDDESQQVLFDEMLRLLITEHERKSGPMPQQEAPDDE